MKGLFFVVAMIVACVQVFGCNCRELVLEIPVVEAGFSLYGHENFMGNQRIVFHGLLIDRKIEKRFYEGPHGSGNRNFTVQYFQLLEPFLNDRRDIIEVRSDRNEDSCEYFAPIGSKVVFTADLAWPDVQFTTHCQRGASQADQPVQYCRYLRFLDSISKRESGVTEIYHSSFPSGNSETPSIDSCLAVSFSCRKGEYHGKVSIYDRKGLMIEKGRYRNGKRIGRWMIKITTYDPDTYEEIYVKQYFKCRNGDCELIE